MYIKIRKINAQPNDSDLVVTISKQSLIEVLHKEIESKWGCEPSIQRLFYKGKQLSDEYRILDYDIQLNDVVQLMVSQNIPKNNITPMSDNSNASSSKVTLDDDKLIECTSTYYKVDNPIDVRHDEDGSWVEYVITSIKAKKKDVIKFEQVPEENITFFASWAQELAQRPIEISCKDMRPRASYTYKLSELSRGLLVMVNYNIEEPNTRGFWYDMIIDSINKRSVTGTLQVGEVPLKNCKVKFVDEIMRIEKPTLLEAKTDSPTIVQRKSQYYCVKCKDNKTKKCKLCGCGKCGGKANPAMIIMCDECDTGYHISCLNPPLEKIPEEDEWYCPECKNDENEIVKVGEKLKSKKKENLLSSKQPNTSGRDWGKGMACVGRTKECTIVPKDHYGPVPGVDVGTCWKFRLQVSEAGIHRPHVAGIHGRETDGAYSLVLSGGYEDDVDNGDEFFYTGSGGRDLSGNKRCAEQSCDQTLTRMNKALAMNCNVKLNNKEGATAENWKGGKPVRVVRNYKLTKHSKYAPKNGNRYDGLYKVVKYYPEKGKSGFIVWRYLLRRDDPEPAPWENDGKELEMIYPPGYIEAQNKTSNSNSDSEEQPKKKRKKVLADKNDNSPAQKKLKVEAYRLSKTVTNYITNDNENEKLWTECNEILKEGKQEFLKKVQDIFMCICCQEVVYEPVTTKCKHNVCKTCIKRSFTSEIYTCPHCRFNLGENYRITVNENLSKALLDLLPGYENGR